MDSDRTFNSKEGNKDRKPNRRFSSGDNKNEKGEKLTSKRIKRKRSSNEDKVNS